MCVKFLTDLRIFVFRPSFWRTDVGTSIYGRTLPVETHPDPTANMVCKRNPPSPLVTTDLVSKKGYYIVTGENVSSPPHLPDPSSRKTGLVRGSQEIPGYRGELNRLSQ